MNKKKLPKIEKNLTSAEAKAFWDHVEQTSKKVDHWPSCLMGSYVFTDKYDYENDEDPDPPSNPAPVDAEDVFRLLGLDNCIKPPLFKPITGQGIIQTSTPAKHICTRSAFPILGKFFCTSCDKDMP